MIIATALTKFFDPIIALDHLTLHVRPGEIYCLLGPNGSGKSTTINLLLGFIKPTRGCAEICGFDVVTQSLEVQRRTALVSENVSFYPNLTAMENLSFFAALLGRKDLKRDDLVQLFRSVGLPEQSFNQRVGEITRGMRQKLAISFALLKDASALLLDEPIGGLDPLSAAELVRLLKEMRDRKKAILMTTHDVFRARQLADTVGFLRDGVLILELRRPDFVHEDLEKLYLKYVAGASGLRT
jgi:ABC-2 type transport system ATP-binding protein